MRAGACFQRVRVSRQGGVADRSAGDSQKKSANYRVGGQDLFIGMFKPALSPRTMAITPVVMPTRAVAPVHDVRAANFVADDSTNDCAYWPCDDGTNASADTNALHLASLGRERRHKQRCHDGCNFPGGAHGYLLVCTRMVRERTALSDVPRPFA